MKKSILFLISSFCVANLFAQYPLNEGKVQLNTGVSFGYSNAPIYLGFDYALQTDVTIGGQLNFHKNATGIIANANYHLNELLKLDKNINLYGGVNLGLYMIKSNGNTSSSSNLNFGGQIGGRYKLSSSIGLNAELGIGNSISDGKIGLSAIL